MKQVIAYPPNIETIDAAFTVRGKRGIIFAYGDTIYNPDNIIVTESLKAHEQVHSDRQGKNPDAWWEKYINVPAFRLNEEIAAHRAEFRQICQSTKSREERAKCLQAISTRLASGLYLDMISPRAARAELQR